MSSDLCSSLNCNICFMFDTCELEEQKSNTNKTFVRLLSCSGCQLVKYCSNQHQKLDWPLHRHFCQAVQKIKRNLNAAHPLYISGIPKNREDIEKAIIILKYLLKTALGRSLEYQEEELTSFFPFCGHCFTLKNLKVVCIKCNSQAYCSEQHRSLHKDEHDKICKLMQIYYCPYKIQPLKEEICMKLNSRVGNLYNMDLAGCVEEAFSFKLPTDPCQSIKNYQLFSWASDFSCIMTVCYAIELLNFQKLKCGKFSIFILGASVEAVLWFREIHCEFLFLQNPQLKEVVLTFIGPEIVETSYNKLVFTFLGSQRIVEFKYYKGLFQDYCKYFLIRPCLIVVFNCGFSEFSKCYNLSPSISNLDSLEPLEYTSKNLTAKDTWFDGLVEILNTFDTPIVFTSFTKQESEFDFGALQNAATNQILKVKINRILNAIKNPFHDLRPLRQWYSRDKEEFYYRNGYIQAIRSRLEK